MKPLNLMPMPEAQLDSVVSWSVLSLMASVRVALSV